MRASEPSRLFSNLGKNDSNDCLPSYSPQEKRNERRSPEEGAFLGKKSETTSTIQLPTNHQFSGDPKFPTNHPFSGDLPSSFVFPPRWNPPSRFLVASPVSPPDRGPGTWRYARATGGEATSGGARLCRFSTAWQHCCGGFLGRISKGGRKRR